MQRTALDQLLPNVFQQALVPGGLLGGLLDVMETLHAPSEAVLADLDAVFDPRRTPDRFVPFLARWTDLERLYCDDGEPLPSHPLLTSHRGHLRELVAAAAELARWRGTARGLAAFLRTATGCTGFRIDDRPLDQALRPIPFHLRVTAPAAARPLRAMVEHLITQEKPAHITWELAFAQEPGDEELPVVVTQLGDEVDDHG